MSDSRLPLTLGLTAIALGAGLLVDRRRSSSDPRTASSTFHLAPSSPPSTFSAPAFSDMPPPSSSSAPTTRYGGARSNISKFSVGPDDDGSDVRVYYPIDGDDAEARVRSVLRRYSDGASHEDVAAELAKIGAHFSSWGDGSPGWSGAYT